LPKTAFFLSKRDVAKTTFETTNLPTEILATPVRTQQTPAGSFVPLPKAGPSQPVAGLSQPVLPPAVSQLPDFRDVDPLSTRNLPRPVTTGPISGYSPAPSPRVFFRDVSSAASTTVIRTRDLSAPRCPPLPPNQQPGPVSTIRRAITTTTTAPLRLASPSARNRSGIATPVPASARSSSPVTISTALPVRRTVRSASPMATGRPIVTRITTLPPDSPLLAARAPVRAVQQPCASTREVLPAMPWQGDDYGPVTTMGDELPQWTQKVLDEEQEDSSQPLPIPDLPPPQRAPGSQNVLPVAIPPAAAVAAQQMSPGVVSRTVTTIRHPPISVSASKCCNCGQPVLGCNGNGHVSIPQIHNLPTPLSSGLLRQFHHIGVTYHGMMPS
jgi:hypothetical protein